MGIKLLLADDSITIQKVVGIIFANEEYELTVVDNGNAALDKARELIPDIILVDALMPGKTGYEVCEGVRRDPSLAPIPLLLLTGAFEPFDEEKARQCGADDFISKPFESQHLIEMVKRLLDLGKERQAAAPVAATFVQQEPVAAPITPGALPADAVPAAAEAVFAPSAEPLAVEPEPFASEGIVEVTSEEDLWGAFELEEEEGAGGAEFGVVEEPAFITPAEEPSGAEEFSFEEEGGGVEPVAAPPVPEPAPFGARFEPVGEQHFEFEGKAVAAEEPFSFEEPLAESEPFAFEESVAEVEPFAFEESVAAEEPFAFEEPAIKPEPLPVEEPAAEVEAEPFAFEEPVAEAEPIAEEEPFAFEEPAPEAEPFTFEEPVAKAEPLPIEEPVVAEEPFSFDEPLAAEEEPFVVEAAGMPHGDAFVVPAVESPEPGPERELVFAPEEEYVPVMPSPATSVAAPVTSAAAAADVTLDEKQLAAALSKVSRDVIERIVWEVVPDLAESLIREEIRKIKEGA